MTDDSIVKIRECCRNLEELDISDLVGISTEALLGLFITEGSTMALADEESELVDEVMNGNQRSVNGNGVHEEDDDDDVNAVAVVTPCATLSLTGSGTGSDNGGAGATTILMDPIGRTMRSIR